MHTTTPTTTHAAKQAPALTQIIIRAARALALGIIGVAVLILGLTAANATSNLQTHAEFVQSVAVTLGTLAAVCAFFPAFIALDDATL